MPVEAQRQQLSQIVSHQHIFISCRASSAHKQSLDEVLADKGILDKISDTKAWSHTAALEQLYSVLHNDPQRACYGPTHVEFATERGAVKTLMVTDQLFRSSDVSTRRHYIKITETAKAGGAEVLIFSDMHVSGEQLQQLSGIAAILRFPLPELDDLVCPASF
ncbi:uncharacterized protein LOC129617992 [Condylostylus longicornis]|uniref:uncharacterized protein LOC129617992 n=1 Tax=Condylostylus longicornis TaxID=2530218 RepID=UPI00244D9A94|nr:uncharacterized protein LOC129617992 [Condylostylus longicornis]